MTFAALANEALRAVAADPGGSGVFCDFDGSLAPIVSAPDEARAVRGASSVLERLSARFRVVAIVSGRSVADLSRRVRAPGVRLIGLHGLEERAGAQVLVRPEAEAAREAVERAAGRLERDLAGVHGAVIERKGLALAVHFRRAPDPVEAERIAAPAVHGAAAGEGLRVVPGRRVLEVRPAAGGDKGDALRRIAAEHGLSGALVAGDDVGDLPMFEAAAELEHACRVAVASSESPPGLAEMADVVLATPADLVALLRRLAAD